MATQGQWGGLFDGQWFGQVGESPPGAMSGTASFSITATATASFTTVRTTPPAGPDHDDMDQRDRDRWAQFMARVRKQAEENILEDEVILMSVMTVVLETT